MKNIKSIKRIWKAGTIGLVVLTMTAGGLFLNLRSVSANPAPNMTVRHEVTNGASGVWGDSVALNPGDVVHFYAEIHNTVVGSTANNVVISATMPTGTFTDGSSVATVRADNANSASDTANIHINGGGKLEWLPNTTRLTWDMNGDGSKEYDNSFIAGSPLEGSGILLGNQQGCNQYIIQIYWTARVTGTPAASPTPTPSPSPTPPASPTPTPTPTSGGDTTITNTNTNTQNQTVNVGSVQGVVTKSPETGVSVAGLLTMFGAGPVGLALSRFGRGRAFVAKRRENLAELAKNLVENRFGKSQDV